MGKVTEWIRGHAILSVVVAFCLGIGAGAGAQSTEKDKPSSPTAAIVDEDVEDEAAAEEEPEEVVEEEPEPEYYRPNKDDFKLKIKVMKESCYGSAGCNTEIRVGLVYLGIGDLDPSKTWEITYKIFGADDPLTSTIEVTGDNYTVDEHFIGTPNGAHLEAVVYRVSEGF